MFYVFLVAIGITSRKTQAQLLALRMMSIIAESIIWVIFIWFFTVQSHLVFIDMTHDRYVSTLTLLATIMVVINAGRMLVLNAQVLRGKTKSPDD